MSSAAAFITSRQPLFYRKGLAWSESPLAKDKQPKGFAEQRDNRESAPYVRTGSRSVLCAIHGDADADRAFATALDLAEKRQAQLHTVCVAEVTHAAQFIGEVDEELKKALDDARRILAEAYTSAKRRDFGIETHLLVGNPVQAIVGLASAMEAELLVIGPSRRSNLEKRVFGSTADRILDLAPCPVVVATQG